MEKVKRRQDNIINNIEKFLDHYHRTPAASRTKGFVQGRVESLQKYWSTFQELHEERLQLADARFSQEEYFIDDHYSHVETSYAAALGELYDDLDNSTSTRPASVVTS
jgi:hypothetical protein